MSLKNHSYSPQLDATSHRRILAIATFLLCCFLSSNVWAQNSRSTALLNIEGQGIKASMASTLTSIVRNEAQQVMDYQIVNNKPIELSEILLLLACDVENIACLKKAASHVKARVLIYGNVTKEKKGHRVKIDIFDADEQRVTHRLQKLIPIGGDFVFTFRQEVETFFRSMKEAANAASLKISSNVRGAIVFLNGEKTGTIPFDRKNLTPGTYKIQVTQQGFSSWEIVVALSKGSELELRAPLKRLPKQPSNNTAKQNNTTKQNNKANNVVKNNNKAENNLVRNNARLNNSSKTNNLTLNNKTRPSDGIDSENWGGWGLMGLGAVSFAGSGVMAALMKGVENDIATQQATNGDWNRANYNALVERGQRYQYAHWGLLALGAVSTTVGVIWVVADSVNNDKERTELKLTPTPTGISASFTW